MKTSDTDGTIDGQQRDRDVVKARQRGGYVEDSHIKAGRVAPTNSHRGG